MAKKYFVNGVKNKYARTDDNHIFTRKRNDGNQRQG